MSDISEHQLIMRFVDGLKAAADAARMLGIAQRNSDFLGISKIIEEISKNGARLATSKSMSAENLKNGLARFSAISADA